MRARPSRINGERLARIRNSIGQTPILAGCQRQPVEIIGLDRVVQAAPPIRLTAKLRNP
jgi:hypothetical protein